MHDYVNLSKAGWDKAAIVNELLTNEPRGETLDEGREAAKTTLGSKSKAQLKADLETAREMHTRGSTSVSARRAGGDQDHHGGLR